MTMLEQWEIISTKIPQLYNRLYALLQRYQADINPNMTFEELCWAVESIPGKVYPQAVNKRPYRYITYNPEGSIIHKDIYVYKKIRYFQEILSYALLYKGVPDYEVQTATTLTELIELVTHIEGMHQSFLALTSYDEVFYYNTYTYIHYDLKDENNKPINEGRMVIKHNGVIIQYTSVGNDLTILPTPVSPAETYEIYYEGTNGYIESNHITITVPIKPAKLLLEISTQNNSLVNREDDITSDDIFFDTDEIEITVQAINTLANYSPMSEVPISIRLPDADGVFYTVCRGVTDINGYFTCTTHINVHNSELEHIYIYAESNIVDEVTVSNNYATKEVFVKWSPLVVPDYKFYTEEENKIVKISYHNIDTGEPTSEYVGDTVRVTRPNNEYTDIFPAANTTSSNYNCPETVVGSYIYTYTLYKNNKIYYQTTDIIKVNPLINIYLYIPDKLLKTSTNTLDCIVEVRNYRDELVTLPNGVYLRTPYDWACDNQTTAYPINNTPTTIHFPISEIMNHCNGFFIQAISVDDPDTYSNIIYVRNHLTDELDNILDLNCTQQTYTLGDLVLNTYGTLIDEENDPVSRSFTMQVKVNNQVKQTYTITPNYRGEFTKNIDILEAWLSDDINIICTFNGDNDYYDPSNDSVTIPYIKADIGYWNITGTGIVYQYCDNNHTIGLTENSIYNKFINGSITYNETTVNINNNQFTTRILPLQAGTYSLTVSYSGNKYYNNKIYNTTITIDKSNDYTFTIDHEDIITYLESVIFVPHFEDGNLSDASHVYTGNINYAFNNPTSSISTNLTSYIYTPTKTGNHEVVITYAGDNNHYPCILTETFFVRKLTPTFSLSVLEYDGRYREEIDTLNPVSNIITYSGNDEGLPIKIFVDNNQIYYNTNAPESANIETLIDTTGIHTITLRNDETEYYYSIDVETEIETYDFVDETYKIFQDVLNEDDYNDEYEVAQKTENIFDAILDNTNNYDNKILERFYNILDYYDD